MKKILLLLAIFSTTLAQAQITVTNNGKTVNDGDVLTFIAEDDGFGEIAAMPSDPFIHNDAENPVEMTVNISKESDFTNAHLSWCFGGECADVDGTTMTKSSSMPSVPMMLHTNFLQEGAYSSELVKVVVEKPGMGFFKETVITFYQKYVYADPSGINELNGTAPAFRLDGKVLTYSFNTAAPRQLFVYSIDGKLVSSRILTDNFGTANLNQLQRGVYVVNLTQQGQSIYTKKVVLK